MTLSRVERLSFRSFRILPTSKTCTVKGQDLWLKFRNDFNQRCPNCRLFFFLFYSFIHLFIFIFFFFLLLAAKNDNKGRSSFRHISFLFLFFFVFCTFFIFFFNQLLNISIKSFDLISISYRVVSNYLTFYYFYNFYTSMLRSVLYFVYYS